MKNKSLIISLLVILAIGLIIYFTFFFTNNNSPKTADYTANRTEANVNNENGKSFSNNEGQNSNNEEESQTDSTNNSENNDENSDTNAPSKSAPDESTPTEPAPAPTPTETEISSFTTKIYTKEANRQNNVQITCKSLNDTVVENGATFSFCNTVGQATTAKGYKKAEIFDAKGNKKQGLGGGNCQISSTLYNAVLKVDSLKVTERHPHSNKVPYIQSGKDAAVAYGSYDFKFVNNSGSAIKIKASATNDNVTISLLKLS